MAYPMTDYLVAMMDGVVMVNTVMTHQNTVNDVRIVPMTAVKNYRTRL